MGRLSVLSLVTTVLICLNDSATSHSNSTNNQTANRTAAQVGSFDVNKFEATIREYLRRADLGDPTDPEDDDEYNFDWLRRWRELQRNRQLVSSGGATYVRWGRNVCQEDIDTELVYSGVAGGGYFHHTGGGSDLICLTRQPEYHYYIATVDNRATIYGAEYEYPSPFFSNRNMPNGLHNQDVPCAVCRAKTRTSMIMIPGRKSCHGEGWTREYWGYLVTEHFAHKNQVQFLCMDEAPEGHPKGSRNDDGAVLYVVEGICGSLPCPPYVNGYELTCTVCTK